MPKDKIAGYLEVGTNGNGEVVINHGGLTPDENGVGHIVFSPSQARHLGDLLLRKADDAALEVVRTPKRRSIAKLRHNGGPCTC